MWSVSNTLPDGAAVEVEDAKMLLREAIRSHRRERPAKEAEKAAAGVAENAAPLLPGVTCAAVYAARPHEPGTAKLMELMHERGVTILLPILGAGLRRDWARYEPGQTLEVRAPGRPPEPEGPGLGEDAIGTADLVVAPALSVDRTGRRLGQGGGWYDRVLTHARPDAGIYAVVFDDEISDEPLPWAEHDHPVHGILTPTGRYALR